MPLLVHPTPVRIHALSGTVAEASITPRPACKREAADFISSAWAKTQSYEVGIVPILQIKSLELRKVKFAQDPTAVKRQAEFWLQNFYLPLVYSLLIHK